MVERFNPTLEYEWLNDGHFTADCRRFNEALTDWLIEYNFHRPHEALAYLTPIEYIEQNSVNLLLMWSVRSSTGGMIRFVISFARALIYGL
jgi:transposase InsO family protein